MGKQKRGRRKKAAKTKGKCLPAPLVWPLSKYESRDREELTNLRRDEMLLLSDSAQKSVAVLLRSHLDQSFLADGLVPRSISPAVREKLRARIRDDVRLADDDRVKGSTLEYLLRANAAYLKSELNGPSSLAEVAHALRANAARLQSELNGPSSPAPPVIPTAIAGPQDDEHQIQLRRVSSVEFQRSLAWPFFRPALTYAIWLLYRRKPARKLSEKEAILAVDSLVHSVPGTDDRTRRALLRFRRSTKRVRAIEELVDQLLRDNL